MNYYHCDDSGTSWNLYAVLQFVNPELGYRTCIGTAVTYGRRCRRTISSSLFNLTQLGAQTPLAAAKSSKLYDLAHSGLCWQHRHQTSEVVARWRGLLYEYAEAQSDGTQPSSRCHSPDPATAGSRPKPWAQEAEPSVEDLMEQIRQLQKKLDAMMRSQQKRSPRSTAGSTASSCKFEEQTKEQEHTDERRQREEREAQAREARKREENERAERARTRRQREQEREQREWSDAWTRYDDGWNNITIADRSLDSNDIPWPTKSGKRTAVTEEEVRQFFRKKPSILLSHEPGEESFRVMSRETKRWHPDKLQCRFGRAILSGQCKDDIDLVSKLIVQLWKEAKMNREMV